MDYLDIRPLVESKRVFKPRGLGYDRWMDPVVTWAVSVMLSFAPPANAKQFPGHEETEEVRTARYQQIAEAAADVAYDPSIKPAYGGPTGRLRTLIALLAVGYHESNYDHDVDVGPCYRGPSNSDARCDHGMSACIMQLHIGNGTTPDGYTQADLFGDRHKCFRAALRGIRASFSECRKLEEKHWFNAYASGTCANGDAASEQLYSLVGQFAQRATLPEGTDADHMRPSEKPAEKSSDNGDSDGEQESGDNRDAALDHLDRAERGDDPKRKAKEPG